jgi:glycosyltransferase involved in cell wall biosynthesis/4-amino-4-deoxy-L-arabinose transferase-like glycosyltransferase
MVDDACYPKTMNIVIASGIYPPEGGGPSVYSHAMARALISMGHIVTVLTYGEGESTSQDGWRVERVSRWGGPLIRYVRFFFRALSRLRSADVVFMQGAVSEGFPTTLAAILRRVPTVLRVPGDYAWEMSMQQNAQRITHNVELLDGFLQKKHRGVIGIYERIERFVAKRASRIIAPSQYLRSVVFRWGVNPVFIKTILNAEDPLPPGKSRDEMRGEVGLEDAVICLTVARAVPWKGVAELIEWWGGLPETHQLVIAGDGPELETWKALAAQSGSCDRIRFLGRQDREQIGNWMRAADVFLLNSGYEGYPHVVAEAASIGLPCFVSDQGGNPETKDVFGDLVTILPYRDQTAWIGALKNVLQSATRNVEHGKKWTHAEMTKQVERVLLESVQGAGPLQSVMFSYDRDLLNPESAAFERMRDLAGDGCIEAILLSRFANHEINDLYHVRAYGFSGNAVRRMFFAIKQALTSVAVAPRRTIVTAQDPFIAGLIGYLVSRWKNVPLEVQEHGDFYSGYWVKESWKNRALSLLGIFILRQAERVRVVSERVKSHLVAIGVDEKRIEVIPVACDLSALLDSDFKPRGDAFHFVAPCRFVEQKGLDILIGAAERLKGEGVRFHLSVIGKGPLLPALHGWIEKAGLIEQVSVHEWKDPTDLWRGADGLVLSSRYEGFARTLVEAMASGAAIVTTDVGCVGSVVRPGTDARVVAIDDRDALAHAMKETIQNVAGTEAMRLSAREQAKRFLSRSELHQMQRSGWRSMLTQTGETDPGFAKWVLGFVLFALATRLASAFLFHASLLNREWGFYTLVEHWFQGYGYSYATELGCPSAYRSPGFLFFLTLLYSVFRPENTLAQALVQNLIAWLALILVYLVGQRFVGKNAALLGAFFMACYPYTFYHFTQYYHTFLSTFLLLFLVWTLLRLKEKIKISTAILAGVSIAALAYIQGTILPATPFIAAWLLWMWWSAPADLRPNWKRAFGIIAIMAVVSAGMIAPWTYRNWNAFHAFVPLTTDLGHGFFKANNEYIYEITKRGYPMEIVDDPVVSSTNPNYIMFSIQPWLKAELEADGVYRDSLYWTEWHPKYPVGKLETCADRGLMNEKQFSDYWMGRSTSWMKTHFWSDAWKLPLQKFKTFWQPGLFPSVKTGAPWSFANDPVKVFLARSAVGVSTFVVVWIGFAGLYLAFKKKRREAVLVLILLCVYSLLHSLFAGYTKYRMPLDHLLAPFAAYALIVFYETRIRRQ